MKIQYSVSLQKKYTKYYIFMLELDRKDKRKKIFTSSYKNITYETMLPIRPFTEVFTSVKIIIHIHVDVQIKILIYISLYMYIFL